MDSSRLPRRALIGAGAARSLRRPWLRASAAAAALALGAAAAVEVHAADLGVLRTQAKSEGKCVLVTNQVNPSGVTTGESTASLGSCPDNAAPGDIITETFVVDPNGVTRSGAGTLTGSGPVVVSVTTTVTRGEQPTYTTTTVKPKSKTALSPK